MAEPSDHRRIPEQTSPYDDVLDVAERHARAWVSGIRERSIPPRLGTDDVKDRLGRESARDRGAADRRDRSARGGRRARPDGHGVTAILRLGHRWNTAGCARCRLAGLRVGPELGLTHGHAGDRRRRGAGGRVARRPAGASCRERGGVRDRCDDGAVHVYGRRARRSAAEGRLGRRDGRDVGRSRGPVHRRGGAPRHGRPRRSLPRPGRADRRAE